ncbi:MAG: hypothetical protein SVQ76_01565 [Candidatus Nanohaloarchaea archaeon]|nr:hypothetical protein [Candidatus Nanohaloarchaea archaeon]
MSTRLLIVLGFLFLLTPTAASAEFRVDMEAGWNIVSVPFSGVESSRFRSGCTVNSGPWHYDASKGKYTKPDTLNAGRGYWVSVSRKCNVTLQGERETATPSLSEGWNLVSTPLKRIKASCTVASPLWGWDPASYAYYRADSVKPTKGYWVNVTGSCTVTGKPVQEEAEWKLYLEGGLNSLRGEDPKLVLEFPNLKVSEVKDVMTRSDTYDLGMDLVSWRGRYKPDKDVPILGVEGGSFKDLYPDERFIAFKTGADAYSQPSNSPYTIGVNFTRHVLVQNTAGKWYYLDKGDGETLTVGECTENSEGEYKCVHLSEESNRNIRCGSSTHWFTVSNIDDIKKTVTINSTHNNQLYTASQGGSTAVDGLYSFTPVSFDQRWGRDVAELSVSCR